MVKFNRKITPDKNVIISSIYPDLYMGKQNTSNIGGGKFEQAYLARFILPNQPVYGSAELSRLDYSVYINSIDLAQNVFAFPEAVVYKTKDSKRLSLTEGIQSINDAKTKEVAIFSSHLNGMASVSENFDGTKQAYGNAVNYIAVQRAIIRESELYVTPTNLYKHGREITWRVNSQNDYTISEFKTNFAYKAEDLGVTDLPEGTLIIPLKAAKKNKEHFEWEAVHKPGKDGWKTTYIPYGTDSIVKSGSRDSIPNTELYGDEMTPSNTVFEIIRGAAEFFGEQTKGEAAVELLGTGAARLSTATKLTGAQSGELYTYWQDGATEVKYPPLGEFTGEHGSTGMAGAEDRQEVMICKKNILYPMKHPAKPYRRGESAHGLGQDAVDFANNIEIDINLKSLAMGYGVTATSGSEFTYATLRRAFVICFSAEPPGQDESFFEFVYKHRDTDCDDGQITIDGSVHRVTPIMDYDTGESTTPPQAATSDDGNVKPFAAVAFVNTPDGVIVAGAGFYAFAANGWGGVQGSRLWQLDETSRDVLINTNYIQSGLPASVLSQWIRLNFLTSAQSYNTIAVGNRAPTHSRLLISQVSDGTHFVNPTYSSTKTYWDINNIVNELATKDFGNWPKHMSIWLNNSRADKSVGALRDIFIEKNANMSSQVFIDKISFKDFNYDIDNPNYNSRNYAADMINISSSPNTLIGPHLAGESTASLGDKRARYETNSPTMLSFGTTVPHHLGWLNANRSDETFLSWTTDEYAWIMLHGFKTTNLANLAEIPDGNMIATYTHAGGDKDEDTGTADTITPHWGECHNTDYGFIGFASALDLPALAHNNSEAVVGVPNPQTNIGLKLLPTGFRSENETGSTATTVRAEPLAQVDDETTYGGWEQRVHHSMRKGDTLIWGANNPSTLSRTINNIVKNTLDDDDFTLTVSAFVGGNGPDNHEDLYIQPEGLINNFSKKGVMMMHLNQSSAGTDLAKSWAKRECSSASARILDVVDTTVHTTTLLLDTVAPLLLEKDEKYIIYLLGADLSTDDFSENSADDTSYVNGTSANAKVDLIIDEINSTTNEIKLSWDGKAQSGVRLLTDANLARLMISPYRHWVHMNIDCSSMDGGAPSTVLPSRTYDAFSVMDHNFAVWDGSSYHTATLAEPLDTTEVDIDVSATTEFSTGDSFMIDDESIYVIAVTSAAAVATITITDTNVLQGRTIIISTTDGIGVTATETDTTTTTDTNTPTFEAPSGSSTGSKRIAAAANIATCLNANSRLTATSSSYVVTITQATAGADGNTNLGGTAEGSGATFTTDFTGGTDSLKVLRGASGTATRKTSGNASGNIGGIYSGDYQVRTAASHSSGAKLKLVTIHSAWGEELSGNYTKNATGGSLDTLEERRNLGSTYNEYLINHETIGGVPGAYVNMWLPTILKEGSIYETGTDFGFGSYKEDEDGGGELAIQILRAGEYNTFKMYDISSSSDFVVGGQLDLFLRYKDDTLGHITNINTRTAASNTPFALAVFEDELPIAPSLSVIPNQEDPFTPEFTWEAADEDLWYGLLHIDTGVIDNQYNGKVAHIPLNEDTTGFGSVYLENESGTKIAAIAGAFSNSYEGLAGFAKDFNGTSDYIKFADFTAPTEEMTVVIHIIPDAASGTSYILNKSKSGVEWSDWEIYMDSSRQIVAKLLPVGVSSNTPVTLTSTPITVDGETPTCIILTLDKNIKSGNCKLFINGKIEDQSGLIKASGAINNWKNDTNLYDSSDALFIGCDVAASGSNFSNLFDGRIEEIVIYNKCLYPVVPSDSKFIFTKPVTEISNQTALSYSARLFVKDYHNIRGATSQEVAASSPVSYRKAAFRLVD